MSGVAEGVRVASSLRSQSHFLTLGFDDAQVAPLRSVSLLQDNRFTELPISILHTQEANLLPMIHRDPFDRLLVAQARSESMTLVTRDPEIHKYDVETLTA